MNSLTQLRLYWGVAFLLFLVGTLCLALLYRFVWTKRAPARIILRNLGASLVSFALTFFAVEFTFALLVRQSDGNGMTLASQAWFESYWKPVNSLGYRDVDVKNFDGRKVIFVVGDSFVAGHGISSIEDRFADRLGGLLGDKWEYVVLAQNGWETSSELRAVQDYPVRPDRIVLSYFINDIHGAADRQGLSLSQHFEKPRGIVDFVVGKSFFLNWAYWRLYRRTVSNDYWSYLQTCYSRPDIWDAHAKELEAFVEHAKQINADLHVVVWPNLLKVAESREITDKVAEFFRSRGVSVTDLAAVFEGRPSSGLIVNELDSHPNARTNEEVSRRIYADLRKARPAD